MGCCLYGAPYEKIVRKEIDNANEIASRKLMMLNSGASRIDMGLEVLTSFITDIVGRDSLQSALFRRFWAEE